MSDYTITKARYAKGQMAVHCQSNGSGFKTRAMRLCEALRGRYSGREDAYIMSPTKATKLERYHREGWDATFVTAELVPPKQ